jgi:hypothetical protein
MNTKSKDISKTRKEASLEICALGWARLLTLVNKTGNYLDRSVEREGTGRQIAPTN